LYRDLSIKRAASLNKLALVIRQSDLSGSEVAAETRSLLVDSSIAAVVSCNTINVTNDLATVFMGLISLQSLAVHGSLALAILPMATRTLRTTLRHLTLVVKDLDTMKSLGYIHIFTNLAYLEVVVDDNTAHPPPMTAWLKPWNLDHLQKLVIKGTACWGFPLASFLSNCRFRTLQSLAFSFPAISAPGFATAFLQFFFQGLPELREAKLELLGFPYEAFLSSLRAISLEISPLTFKSMQTLSTCTTSIRIPLSALGGAGSMIWAALDGLIAAQQTSVKSVYLVGNSFSWISEESSNSVVTADLQALPYLLRYSALLRKVGIDLMDESGKTLRDYL
jgi:hypothetical protein